MGMFRGMKRIARGINPLHAGLMGAGTAAMGSALQSRLMRPQGMPGGEFSDDLPESAYDPAMQLGITKGGASRPQGMGDKLQGGMNFNPAQGPMQTAVRRMRVMAKGGI